jgi:hypothetical protein
VLGRLEGAAAVAVGLGRRSGVHPRLLVGAGQVVGPPGEGVAVTTELITGAQAPPDDQAITRRALEQGGRAAPAACARGGQAAPLELDRRGAIALTASGPG